MNVGGVPHYGMLTAGHCWPSSTVVYQGYYDNNGILRYTGTMGNVGARSYSNNAADAEFVDSTATGTQVSNLVWVGPNPTLNASKVAVQGTSFVGLGECFEGSTTGENCSAVVQQVDICIQPAQSPTLCHLDDNTSSNGSTLATGGDSGGPVTKGDSFGGLVAYGTDSAGTSTHEYDTKLDFSLPALNASLVISSLGTTLFSNQPISGDQYLEAANGRYKLIMQSSDGNLVLYSPSTALWASGTQGHPGDFALMQSDGNFVIYRQGGGIADWASGTQGNPGAYLIMQGDGNLVIYRQGGVAIWSSGTCCNRP